MPVLPYSNKDSPDHNAADENLAALLTHRVVLWSPHHSNRFVVGSPTELRSYEWEAQKAELRQIALKCNMQPMRCFAWSPHSAYDDLFAMGTSGGQLELCHATQGQPLAPASPNDVAHKATSISLTFPTKQRRLCNDLSFCPTNANLLASAHDRYRADPNIYIWDVSRAAPTYQVSTIDDSYLHSVVEKFNHTLGLPDLMRVQRTQSLGGVRGSDSNRRAQSTASTVLNPGSRPAPSRERPAITKGNGRSAQDTSTPWAFHFSPSDSVKQVTFLPHGPNLLIASVSPNIVRLFDQRIGHHISETLSTATVGLCCDPITGDRFAGFNTSGVTVWDYRRLADPLITFSEDDAGSDLHSIKRPRDSSTKQFMGVEFCKTRRGVLGTLHRGGDYVRLWDLVDGGRVLGDLLEKESKNVSGPDSRNKALWGTSPFLLSHENRQDEHPRPNDSTVREYVPSLAGCRTTKNLSPTAVSFAFLPGPATLTTAPHIVTVSNVGEIQLAVVRDAPRHTWSCRGDLLASVGRNCKLYQANLDSEQENLKEPWDAVSESPPSPSPIDVPHQDALLRNNDAHKFGWLSQQKPPLPTESLHAPASHHTSLLSSVHHLSGPPTTAGRKYSPASMMRIPLDKKIQSPQVTPKPGALNLEAESSTTKHIASSSHAAASATPYTKSSPVKDTLDNIGTLSHSRHRATGHRSERRTAESFLVTDMSTVMRQRVMEGYGLESTRHNGEVVRDERNTATDTNTLSDVWMWLYKAGKILRGDIAKETPAGHVHGFDFTLKGVLSILEGWDPMTPVPSTEPPTMAPRPTGTNTRRYNNSMSAARKGEDKQFGDWHAAVDWVLHRHRGRRWEHLGLPKMSKKTSERQLALALIEWDQPDKELDNLIGQWEKDGHTAKAACWALFMSNPDRAVEILGRSRDERYRILSGTVAGLASQLGSNEPRVVQWREKCLTLTARLDDPHARMLVTWLATQDWQETVEEPIPLTEKLAIALRFFGDSELVNFLHKRIREGKQHGDLNCLILTGIKETSVDILQAYVDNTGDVQTAAILGGLMPHLYVQDQSPPEHRRARGRNSMYSTDQTSMTDDSRSTVSTDNSFPSLDMVSEQQRRSVQSWIDSYRDLLDSWRLFHNRAHFDIHRGELVAIAMSPRQSEVVDEDGRPVGRAVLPSIPPMEWVPRTLQLVCQSCQRPIGRPGPKLDTLGTTRTIQVTSCPHCAKRLPRCCICAMHLNAQIEPPTHLARSSERRDTMDESFVWCQNCRHGGHASHILTWFYGSEDGKDRAHDVCPVDQCNCRCSDE